MISLHVYMNAKADRELELEAQIKDRWLTAMAEQPARWIWTRIGKNGAVELPEALRAALAIREGDSVQLVVEDDAIRILTREAALRALTSDVRRYIPEGVSLVDELIGDRRAEAAREASGD
ncbi:MAG: AbrB/MazE/SpoVT family DNA-binding domain-containing protein [Chloroflexi bacterium]|nr:AbrB/MazE/SpoVT family DNA-binding domain-containing protein [Chloroflexota bacterium]